VPVSCARQADCPTGSECCATNAHQSCVLRGTCTGGFVCDPSASPSECPGNTQCTPFGNPGVPYYECL
jgi:hypothetical protein